MSLCRNLDKSNFMKVYLVNNSSIFLGTLRNNVVRIMNIVEVLHIVSVYLECAYHAHGYRELNFCDYINLHRFHFINYFLTYHLQK